MRLKIGVVTYFDGLNYGAVLQAYSTFSMLRELGHDTVMIRYSNTDKPQFPWTRLFRFRSPTGLVANINEFARQNKFLSFRPYFKKTRRYSSVDDLNNDPPDVEALICGSDTIWSPRNFAKTKTFDPYWFLGFGGDDVGRIAYAPSFWRGAPLEFLKAIRPCLDRFDAIAVREEEHAKILSDFLGRHIPCVCDPAILYGAEGMNRIINETTPKESDCQEEYALVYPLTIWKTRDVPFYRELNKVFCQTKIIGCHWPLRVCGSPVIPNPGGFLRLIRGSRFVVTSAFHGTVYAVLSHRPFVTLGWQEEGQNVRMRNFLSKIGLSDRFLVENDVDAFRRKLAEPIDWAAVDEKIAAWRAESMAYLKESLEKVIAKRKGKN